MVEVFRFVGPYHRIVVPYTVERPLLYGVFSRTRHTVCDPPWGSFDDPKYLLKSIPFSAESNKSQPSVGVCVCVWREGDAGACEGMERGGGSGTWQLWNL